MSSLLELIENVQKMHQESTGVEDLRRDILKFGTPLFWKAEETIRETLQSLQNPAVFYAVSKNDCFNLFEASMQNERDYAIGMSRKLAGTADELNFARYVLRPLSRADHEYYMLKVFIPWLESENIATHVTCGIKPVLNGFEFRVKMMPKDVVRKSSPANE